MCCWVKCVVVWVVREGTKCGVVWCCVVSGEWCGVPRFDVAPSALFCCAVGLSLTAHEGTYPHTNTHLVYVYTHTRTHHLVEQHALESYPMFIVLSFIGGLKYPVTTAIAGLVWMFARLKWAEGYGERAFLATAPRHIS